MQLFVQWILRTNNQQPASFSIHFISYFILYDWKWTNVRWFEWLKMDGFLLYISYDEIDQTRESICTWRRYTKTYIVLQKEHEWFIFVKLSYLIVSNRLHKTFTTSTETWLSLWKLNFQQMQCAYNCKYHEIQMVHLKHNHW